MANVIQIPPKLGLPVSRGGDLIVDFTQKVNDVYTDYSAGVSVQLQVDVQNPGKPPPPPTVITATAEINNYHAVCRIESEVADVIPNGSLWRCVVSYPTSPTTEVVGINGRIQRSDGA